MSRHILGRARTRLRRLVGPVTCAAAAWCLNGAAAPANQPNSNKAWFDAKSVCVFPLSARQMPSDREELMTAMVNGWKGALRLPDPDKVITAEGGAYPSITTLRIDLSDAVLRSEKKKAKLRLSNNVEKSLDVDHLEVVGDPLLLNRAKLHLSLTATGAELELERDKKGKPLMMLADAKGGKLTFDVTMRDIESLLLHGAREAAGKYGITIEKTKLNLVAQTPRSIQASLYVATKVGFIPAGMLFKAHVLVDDAMNAKLTGLTCDGDEALGPLIVSLLRPALADYEGKTRPLLSFPAGHIKLKNLQLRIDDAVHLVAEFGS